MTAGRTPRPAGATLITVAPTGAESQQAAVPALPVALDELVGAASECQAAEAAVIHVHVRDGQYRPTLDLSRLTDTVRALRESTDLIVQLSTGGAVGDGFEQRLAVLDAAPDACSLTCGMVNFGDEVFLNPWPFIRELYARTQAAGVVPEFELFDLGQAATLHRLLAELGPPYGGHVHCDLVMGVPGGMAGDAATLVAAVAALPAGATWSATGIGRSSSAMPPAGGSGGSRGVVPPRWHGHAGGAGRRRAPAGWPGGHRVLRPRSPGDRQHRTGDTSGDPGRAGTAPGHVAEGGKKHAGSGNPWLTARSWPRSFGRAFWSRGIAA
jgi:uncharacterized protein (DUF849 family)